MLEAAGYNGEALRRRSGRETAVPRRQDQLAVSKRQRGRQVNGVGTAEGMRHREACGVVGDLGGDLDDIEGGEIPAPLVTRDTSAGSVHAPATFGRCERGAHLRNGEPTRNYPCRSVPQGDGNIGSQLLDEELEQSTAIPERERHGRRAVRSPGRRLVRPP